MHCGSSNHQANGNSLEDKTWFIILLVLGLFSFGLFAMIAYVIGGPDGIRQPRPSVDVQARL